MNNPINTLNKWFDDIGKSIEINNNLKYNEHYIGVVIDDDTERYENMKTLFDNFNNEKLEMNFESLKTNINRWKKTTNQPTIKTNDLYNMSIGEFETTNEEILKDKYINKANLKRDEQHMDYDRHHGRIFQWLKHVVSYYKHYIKDNNIYHPEFKISEDVLEDFKKRRKIIEYLKNHFTYIFISKDGTFTYKNEGDKSLPINYCKKNCIYNSHEQLTPFNNQSERYIKNNTNIEILKILDENKFPTNYNTYLIAVGIDKSMKENSVSYLDDNYCGCNTVQNKLNGDGSKLISGCYNDKNVEDVIYNDSSGCGPNRSTVEGFNVHDNKKLFNHFNNKINNIENSYVKYNENNSDLSNGITTFNNLTNKRHKNNKIKNRLVNSDEVYKQMIKDNILISNRYTILRYLIIIILIFSILLLMKYINIL